MYTSNVNFGDYGSRRRPFVVAPPAPAARSLPVRHQYAATPPAPVISAATLRGLKPAKLTKAVARMKLPSGGDAAMATVAPVAAAVVAAAPAKPSAWTATGNPAGKAFGMNSKGVYGYAGEDPTPESDAAIRAYLAIDQVAARQQPAAYGAPPGLGDGGMIPIHVGRRMIRRKPQLGDYDDATGELGGLGSVLKKVGKAVGKAVTDVSHVVGKVVTSAPVKAVLGTALAATGVGIPAAALIMGGSAAAGDVLKGTSLKTALKEGAKGGVEGAGASVVGKVVKKVAPGVTDAARAAVNKALPGNPLSRVKTSTVVDAAVKQATKGGAPVDRQALLDAQTQKSKALTDQVVQDALARQAALDEQTQRTKDITDQMVRDLQLDRLPDEALPPARVVNITPPVTRQKVTKPATATPSTTTRAQRVGATVRSGTDTAAAGADQVTKRAGQLRDKAMQLAAAGDALGAEKFAQLATQVATQAQNVVSAGGDAGAMLRGGGYGFEQGATAGDPWTKPIVDWIKDNPIPAAAVGAGGAFVLYQALKRPGRRAARRR